MYKSIYTEVEVDVNLSDFDTDDLIEELESRGLDYNISEGIKNGKVQTIVVPSNMTSLMIPK